MKKLVVSFSGGETSAYMCHLVQKEIRKSYSDVVFVFANTGQENEETLEFANKCDTEFGLNLVWLEAEVNQEKGEGTKHKVVTFENADRAGDVFEDVIKKYGIPGPPFPHCTRELKIRPIESYLKDIGLTKGSYDTAIGIRADEIDRVAHDYKSKNIIYPLAFMFPSSKADVNSFWEKMPFRLDLKGYQGNCKWCWKKSTRKLVQIMRENPDSFDFPEMMERKHPHAGMSNTDDPRRFFRGKMTVNDIRELSKNSNILPPLDDARFYQMSLFSSDYDVGGGCSDGCEIFHEE